MSHSSKARKTLVQQIKSLRRLNRIANSPSRPYGTTSEKDAAKRAAQEAHDRKWAATPDKAIVAYFMTPNTVDDTRRARQ